MPARTTARTTGRFTFADWEEQPIGSAESTPRLARSTVVNSFAGGIEAGATSAGYTFTYIEEGAGSYTGMELLSGTVDGRKGTFVMEQRGTFDAAGTRCTFEVVPGSATGELAGLSGSGSFTYRKGDMSVPYEFTYTVA
ncbi:DUF3224 domain-containing protein [Streptomyces sp. KS 21]|uniref:DUF3224 domain-containing protein n=1 Tax=Streptomyces sp. KS 21 TaxID=2485150 RepID=UPI001062BEEF|nr:DUF3224 domain-containing protein [Streptomyces sp. KS 21]TDU79822.1 uncharacterized protein DUF3224 [Streptomyces sp. KS 21]